MNPQTKQSPLLRAMAVLACTASLVACVHSDTAPQQIDAVDLLSNPQKGRSLYKQRATMVENIRTDVRAADPSADTVAFEKTLGVVGSLPREAFVQKNQRGVAYVDLPQEIGFGQTISGPYIVSVMTAALELSSDANVLDVGTGSGYQAAVLARIASHVSSIEIVVPLAVSAAARPRRLGFSNVDVRSGDGFLGWPEHAPFDGIIVAASATAVPAPLLRQLRPGGRLVMPVGATDATTQLLRLTKRADGTIDRCSLGGTLFVPLTGAHATPFARYGVRDRSIPLCFQKPIVSVF